MKHVIYFLTYPIRRFLRAYLPNVRAWFKCRMLFAYDRKMFFRWSGSFPNQSRETLLAKMIMAYHQIEKGLTMPHRRLNFGHGAVDNLIALVREFERRFGRGEKQLAHAVGTLKAYFDLHQSSGFDFCADDGFWKSLKEFLDEYKEFPSAPQMHFTRDEFFAANELPFPAFACSRHTSRHFEGAIDSARLHRAIELALTTPSACNRQHTRVHLVSDYKIRDQVFANQNGNRGFGSEADKIIILTTDLRDIMWDEERNDAFTNVGMFAMNLCYCLHYYRIAHCVLNCSVPGEYEDRIKRIVGIPEYERPVLILACGNAPEEFDVAASPRKALEDILTEHV